MTSFSLNVEQLPEDEEGFITACTMQVPKGCTNLSLSECGLYRFDANVLRRLFSSLTTSLKILDLRLNALHLKTPEELVIALSGIHVGVEEVNISGNNLSKLAEANLIKVIQAIAPGRIILADRTVNEEASKNLAKLLSAATGKSILTKAHPLPFFKQTASQSSDEPDHKDTPTL
jgi:hypothetical protein